MRSHRHLARPYVESLEARQHLTAITVTGGTYSETAGGALFHVSLDAPASRRLTLQCATTPVTAWRGKDFRPGRRTLTFSPGQSTADVSVPLVNDTIYEGDEALTLTVKGRNIAPASAIATILSEDPAPTVRLIDQTIRTKRWRTVRIRAELVGLSELPVSVDYYTADGSAQGGTAFTGGFVASNLPLYVSTSGTLTFRAGQRVAVVLVDIQPEQRLYERQEKTFHLRLTNPVDALVTAPDAGACTVTVVIPGSRLAGNYGFS